MIGEHTHALSRERDTRNDTGRDNKRGQDRTRSTGITKIKLPHTYDFRLLTRIKFVPYLWFSPFFTMSTHETFLFSMDSSFDNSTTVLNVTLKYAKKQIDIDALF